MVVGVYRGYEEKMDDFIVEILNTPEGNALGWPFKRTATGANPTDIVFAPWVSAELKTHVLGHPSSRTKTVFPKDIE